MVGGRTEPKRVLPRAPERGIFVKYFKSSTKGGDIYDECHRGDDGVGSLRTEGMMTVCDTCGVSGGGDVIAVTGA